MESHFKKPGNLECFSPIVKTSTDLCECKMVNILKSNVMEYFVHEGSMVASDSYFNLFLLCVPFVVTIRVIKISKSYFKQANGEAALGKYAAGSVVGAGADATLFVANHAY